MRSLTGRRLENDQVLGQCKNYLCAPESRMKEWFPTLLQGRLRAKALDPYGIMKTKVQKCYQGENSALTYSCKIETCHAKICLRKVKPDPEGNGYGLYGCFEHQHELYNPEALEEKKTEIVFKSRQEADDYFKKHFKVMYAQTGEKRKEYEIYKCRRRVLKEGQGYHPCKSFVSIVRTFGDTTLVANSFDGQIDEEKPFSLNGIFWHPHSNDVRFHKTEYGSFKKYYDDPSIFKKRRKPEIRIKDGKIFPIYARKYVSIEDVLAARVGKGGHKRKKKGKPPVHFKEGTSITTNMIDLEEIMRDKESRRSENLERGEVVEGHFMEPMGGYMPKPNTPGSAGPSR